MDDQRFDALAKTLSRTSRRRALRLFAGGALGAALTRVGLSSAGAQDGTVTASGSGGGTGDRCNDSHDCKRGLRCCGSRCRSISTDENNCGSCGTKCGAGETCVNGGCFRNCRSARQGVCNTNACGSLCGCNTTLSGAGVCESLRGSCTDARACNSNSDCRSGQLCVNDSCCAGKPKVCARPCGTVGATAQGTFTGPTRVPNQ
jgi:hypothetical protein